MTKVLVTGGAGFIGSHIVDALVAGGHDVLVVDDLSHGDERNLNGECHFYRVDIRSSELEQVFREKPAVVIHHAARTSVPRSIAAPVDDAEVNVLGSLRLLQLCVKAGVRKVIYASSGGAIYGEPRYLPCDESHPIAPLSPYGVSKYAVELYLQVSRVNHGLDYTILRYSNVYGPRQATAGEAAVVARFSSQMLRGLDITINGTGEQERDFVYVGDIVQANLLAMAQVGSGTYNLGSEKGVTVNWLFEQLKRLTGYKREPLHAAASKGEVFKTCLSAKKAGRDLGWTPQTDLPEGLEKTVDFYKKDCGN